MIKLEKGLAMFQKWSGAFLIFLICLGSASAEAGRRKMDLELSVKCEIADTTLRVNYEIHNKSRTDFLFYDGAPGLPMEAPWPDLGGQILILSSKDSLVLKRVLVPPRDRNSDHVFIPPLSHVGPMGKHEVQFSLKLPLTEYNPAAPDFPGATYEEKKMKQIELVLGYFEKSEKNELMPYSKNPKAFRISGSHGEQKFLSKSTSCTVPLRVRTDKVFWRP